MNQIRPRKVPLPNLDRAAYLERDTQDCIEHGQNNKFGYASLSYKGTCISGHRLAYCKHNGIEPDEIKGKVVRHTCDNNRCVNPMHLVLGTVKDNRNDTISRLRFKTNLTPEIVRKIREEYALGGVRQVDLQEKYGADQTTISKIVRRKSWQQVD